MSGAFLFVFVPQVPIADAEMSLHLAMFAVEGLAGRVRVRMDTHYRIDEDSHAILIDGGNRVSQMIARVFAGLLHREFGEDSFQFRRVCRDNEHSDNTRKPEEAFT